MGHIDTGAPIPTLTSNRTAMVRDVIAAACRASGYTRQEMLSARRTPRIVGWRHAAMEVAGQLSGKSLPQIGRIFGRDHSTIISARRAVAARIAAGCQDTRAQLDAICAALEGIEMPALQSETDPEPEQPMVVEIKATPRANLEQPRQGPFSRKWFLANDARFRDAVVRAHPELVHHDGD